MVALLRVVSFMATCLALSFVLLPGIGANAQRSHDRPVRSPATQQSLQQHQDYEYQKRQNRARHKAEAKEKGKHKNSSSSHQRNDAVKVN